MSRYHHSAATVLTRHLINDSQALRLLYCTFNANDGNDATSATLYPSQQSPIYMPRAGLFAPPRRAPPPFLKP